MTENQKDQSRVVFDIGGTNTRVALFQGPHDLHEISIFPTNKSYDQGVNQLVQAASTLLHKSGARGISGGIACNINDNGDLVNPAHLPSWGGHNLEQELSKKLAVEVRVANDSELSAVAEAKLGAGKDYSLVGSVSIGTGIGGALVVDGELASTNSGFEPGHMIIDIDSSESHWEELVSGTALHHKYKVNDISELAESEIDQLHSHLAIGLYNLSVTWSPKIIVIGGGIGNHSLINLDTCTHKMSQLNHNLARLPILRKSQFGDTAVLVGAGIRLI